MSTDGVVEERSTVVVNSNDRDDDDDDDLTLCASTMAILQEFLKEQQQAQKVEEHTVGEDKVLPGEDWQLSQFWYDDATAQTLVEEALTESKGGRVACLSTPSVYRSYLKLQEESKKKEKEKEEDGAATAPPYGDFYLFEFDRRFRELCEPSRFIFYDYKQPKNIPKEHRGVYDFVLFDPPFLSEECLEKFAITARLLMKPDGKLMALTGRRQASNLKRIFSDKLEPTTYVPGHINLCNEFVVAINYKSQRLTSTTWSEFL